MWLFEIRSVEAQSLGEVFSSIILASLQMLDHGRSFLLGQEVRHFAEHLVREFAHVLIRPVLNLRESEDRGKLPSPHFSKISKKIARRGAKLIVCRLRWHVMS